MHWEAFFFPLAEPLKCRPGERVTATIAQCTRSDAEVGGAVGGAAGDAAGGAVGGAARDASPTLPCDKLRMWYEWSVTRAEEGAPGPPGPPARPPTRHNAGGAHSIILVR